MFVLGGDLKKLSLAGISLMALSACGGSGDDNTSSIPSVQTNTAPTIQTPSFEGDSVTTGDTVTISVTATDTDSDSNLNVVCRVNNTDISMNALSNSRFSGSYTPDSFGLNVLTCSASDGQATTVSGSLNINVLPNAEEVTSLLEQQCEGSFSGQAAQNGLAELGTCVNESTNERVGYTLSPVNEEILAFNGQPYSENASLNPNYIAVINTSVEGIEVASVGPIFASELLTQTQIDSLITDDNYSYVALNAVITDDLDSGNINYVITGNIDLDGPSPQRVSCGDILLSSSDDSNSKFQVLQSTLADRIDSLKTNESQVFSCKQIHTLESGELVESNLRASLQVDYTALVNSEPPFFGTTFINPNIITSDDLSVFREMSFKGRGIRTMFDRRSNSFNRVENVFLFDANFDNGAVVEIQVNPEFGSVAAAEREAEFYSQAIGRIPSVLFGGLETVWIHNGDELFGGGNNNILIHTIQGERYASQGILEETLVHEGVHTSLDAIHANSSEWIAAQQADLRFISRYARDFPQREDLAESFLVYLAVQHRSKRLTSEQLNVIRVAIPNRLAYFAQQEFDMFPIN